ncbi:hypothetical protein D477_020523 [Arthrobacter crystallopoietes BAB-32]|uniref:DUF4192 family protein n=1 Tax=Arthrobacter crystallopoietes BAB-32 TaxID=1246476 RepID=N1UTI9_9MICC|nr:DUF4192 domain-containing protein [Arthrobacter crystallopoietes]EMY32370.1 hypothetical protein D477_020523 [Arthrobacter crystallopoietes BAB-32]
MNKKLTATTGADLISFAAHVLGFQPSESLVVLTFHGTGSGTTLRLDLPHSGQWPRDFAQTAASYLCRDENADGSMFIVYTDRLHHDTGLPYEPYIDALREELTTAGMPIRDGWIVTGTGWATYPSTPGHNNPAHLVWQDTAAITNSVINSELIYLGSSPAPAAEVPAPACLGTGNEARRIAELAARYETTGVWDQSTEPMLTARRTWAAALHNGTEPDATEAPDLAGLFQTPAVRDRLMADLLSPAEEPHAYKRAFFADIPTAPDQARLQTAERILIQSLRFTPGPHRAPLLTVLGWINWLRGKGTFADLYLGKALEADPGYRLAELLRQYFATGALPKIGHRTSTR